MKNLIKSTVLLFVMLLSAASFAQTGPFIKGGIESNNLGRQQRLLMNYVVEAGYQGEIIGVSATYHETFNLYKGSKVPHHNPKGEASSYGLRVSAKLFQYENIRASIMAEGNKYIAKIDKKINGEFEFRPGFGIDMPIYKNLRAGVTYYTFIYKQNDEVRHKNGGQVSISYFPFGK